MISLPETSAALLLLCAGVIHNYSFMCRKLPRESLRGYYPASGAGQFLLNLSWMCLAAGGLLLCSTISTPLFWVAVGVYFFLFPFLLQPALAKLLGFGSLHEYVEKTHQHKRNSPEP